MDMYATKKERKMLYFFSHVITCTYVLNKALKSSLGIKASSFLLPSFTVFIGKKGWKGCYKIHCNAKGGLWRKKVLCYGDRLETKDRHLLLFNTQSFSFSYNFICQNPKWNQFMWADMNACDIKRSLIQTKVKAWLNRLYLICHVYNPHHLRKYCLHKNNKICKQRNYFLLHIHTFIFLILVTGCNIKILNFLFVK